MSESTEERHYEVEFSNLYAIGPSREGAKAKFDEMVQQAAKDGWKLPEGLALQALQQPKLSQWSYGAYRAARWERIA